MAAQDLSGALPRGVAIIRKSLMPITLGMAGGFAGAIASGRYLEHLIVSAQPLDLPNCVTAAVFLLVTAVGAAWSASARILTINPMDALRAE